MRCGICFRAPHYATVVCTHGQYKVHMPVFSHVHVSGTCCLSHTLPAFATLQFGLPVGKHVFIYATINGENVMRAYTPTSQDDDLGYFDLIIKVYRANQHPKFPEGGKMSQYLDTLAIGDEIEVKGPVGHFVYEGRGKYSLNRKPKSAK